MDKRLLIIITATLLSFSLNASALTSEEIYKPISLVLVIIGLLGLSLSRNRNRD